MKCKQLFSLYIAMTVAFGSSFSTFTAAADTTNISIIRAIKSDAVSSEEKCGENLTWKLTDDGTLIISGTGSMTEWDDYKYYPWFFDYKKITKVIIENGVTNIGKNAFSFMIL